MDDANDGVVWLLTSHLAMLSFAAIGGGVIMLAPDIHRYVAVVHQWIGDEQFAAAYAIAQAAPGPNMLFVTLIGWQIAGWLGAIGATAGVILPPAALTYVATAWSSRRPRVGPIGRAVRNGLAPLSVGLLLASVWVLFDSTRGGWREAVVAAITLVVMLTTRLNPLWLIVAGAIAGIAGVPG